MQRYVVVMVLLLCSALAHAIPVADVPNPFVTPGLFVVDQGQVLTPDDRAIISATSQQLRDKTSVELVVITVDTLDGLSVEDYAEQLFKRLGIGEKEKDNGVLILLARDDRRVRIEVGYGLESVLNDAKAGRILDESAVPYLKNNEFGRGIREGAKAVALALDSVTPESISSAPALNKRETVVAAMSFFTIILTAIAFITKVFTLWRRKTRSGRRAAISLFGNSTASMMILAPLATVMVGYSEGVFWTGILVAFIPLISGILVYLGFQSWAKRVAKWRPKCDACRAAMTYNTSSIVEASVEDGAKAKSAERRELWTCPQCHVEKTLADTVYMGTRSSSGWSYSRPGSGSGRSGGGSSGGGGASRGF